jgi:hypothetical protein
MTSSLSEFVFTEGKEVHAIGALTAGNGSDPVVPVQYGILAR